MVSVGWKDKFNLSAMAGSLFALSNAGELVSSLMNGHYLQSGAAALMLGCSFSIIKSHKVPKALIPAGAFLIAGQVCNAVAAGTGDGAALIHAGAMLPVLQGGLLIRAGWQSITQHSFKAKSILGKAFEIIDTYPLAAAGLIEAPGTAAMAVGAFMGGNLSLAIPATGWTVANLLLAASDKNLQRKIREFI